MRVGLVIEPGNTPILQAVVRDSITGLPSSTATVLCAITDAQNNPVANQQWPVSLLYVPGSQGIYRAALSAQTALVVGQSYKANFAITANGATTNLVYDLDVRAPGDYDPDSLTRMQQPPSLLQRLREAEAAYHDLIMGKAVAMIKDQNGEEITYSITNRAALAQYIAMLQRSLGMQGSLKPATVSFGECPRPWPWSFRI